MSLWSVAVAVEVAGCALFTGALLLLRPWLRAPVLRICALLWTGRAIASLIVFRFVAAPTYFSLLLYVPLQFALALALAFAGRSLVQHKVQIARLQRQLDQLQRELVTRVDLDPLTGLLNRSALARWLEEETHFQGMVV